MQYKKIDVEDIEYMKRACSPERVYAAANIHDDFTHDEMPEYGRFKPDAVVEAVSAEEVSAIMKFANENGIPVTPRGSGTGLCGGAVAINGFVDAVIFDMDGLIFDTESIYKKVWQESAKDLGFIINNDFWATLVGIKNEECECRLQHKLGANFSLNEFNTIWKRNFNNALEISGMEYKHGFKCLLTYLKSRGFIVGLATSASKADIRRNFRLKPEIEMFNLILSGDDVKKSKPNPEIYLKAVEILKIDAGKILVFEDSNNGMRAAINAGCKAVMIPDILQPDEYIKENAYMILNSLGEAIDNIFEKSKL